jgi:hypothetical protein
MRSRCPICDRYIGRQDECPYCGCDALTPLLLKRFRLISVMLGVVGIMFLFLMSMSRGLPLVMVGRVTPMMNFARVRMEGVLERNVYVARKEGVIEYMSFYLDDGTGIFRVAAYSDVADKLGAGKMPKKGDRVEVSGSLRVVAGKKPTLRLGNAGIRWK